MQYSKDTYLFCPTHIYFFRLLQIIDEDKAMTSSQALANRTLELIEQVESKAIPKTAIKVYLYLQSLMDESTFSCFPAVKTISEGVRMHYQTVRKNLHLLEKLDFIEIKSRRHEDGGVSTNEYFLKMPFFVVPPYEVYEATHSNINNINKEKFKKSEKNVGGYDHENHELLQELIAVGCFPSFAQKAINRSAKQTRDIFESFKETNKTTYLLEKYKPALFGALKMLTENATIETITSKYEFTKQKTKSKPLYYTEIKSESGLIIPIEFNSRKDAFDYIKDEFQYYNNEDEIRIASERWLDRHLKLIV